MFDTQTFGSVYRSNVNNRFSIKTGYRYPALFRGMKTTTVPEMVLHIFIVNDACSVEKIQCMLDAKTISDSYEVESYKIEHVKCCLCVISRFYRDIV